MPPTLLTILTLAVPSQHASDAPYHPYAHGVPSRHASDATYHPYTCILPAQHSSVAAYHPYASSALLTCLPRPPHTLPPSPPSPPLMLPHPQLIFSAASHPYAPAEPSRYASDATLNPPYA
ncbi:hypothetical protein O181_086874 [Austropuccinia psidii MF-1]|uniref:Uncharacterized protein n=1 Tax=Austropuccinia psidii MF-1 TaxID=1389203 RepID=A0A9Q3P0K0_9BASI|nr:hypothetical protein [Austropuccinia psidii MF-1]